MIESFPGFITPDPQYIMIPAGSFYCPYWILSLIILGSYLFGTVIALAAYDKYTGGDPVYDFLTFFDKFR